MPTSLVPKSNQNGSNFFEAFLKPDGIGLTARGAVTNDQ